MTSGATGQVVSGVCSKMSFVHSVALIHQHAISTNIPTSSKGDYNQKQKKIYTRVIHKSNRSAQSHLAMMTTTDFQEITVSGKKLSHTVSVHAR